MRKRAIEKMSLTDKYCNSPDFTEDERQLCYEFASDLQDIIADLDGKGYLRSELKLKQGEEERKKFTNVLLNVRKVGHAFNMFFDMYVDRVKPDSKQRLKKFLELNKPYGLTEEDLVYLILSEMVYVFIQNVEEFRATLLYIMKLPIRYLINGQNREINEKTTLGTLLRRLKDLGINKADTLLFKIDVDLRNGLSHCLFWFDMKYLNYSEDTTFQNIKRISILDFYKKKARRQSIYTNCLLNVIADWF